MTLREEYEKEVDRLSEENLDKPSIVSSLFKKSNQHYIEWLETELKKLRVADVSGRSEQLVCTFCGINPITEQKF
jgi:hypothetical protein